MSNKLSKKQAELLSQFSHDELLVIIQAMLDDNSEASQFLILNYLMSPEEKLKNIEKVYKKLYNKKGQYDYWKSHAFFIELEKTVAEPLNQLAVILVENTLKLTTKLILDFEALCEKYDTSSGSWQDYLEGLLTAWLKALAAAFKQNPAFDVVTPYLHIKANCDCFPMDLLARNKMYFPTAAIKNIRDTELAAGDVEHALALSFVLKDFPYLRAAYAQNRLGTKAACLEYAHILLEDFQTEAAVNVLQKLQSERLPSSLQSKVDTLLVQAVYENGDTQAALALCVNYFSKALDVEYLKKYIKYHPSASSDEIQVFYRIANTCGAAAYLNFVAIMGDWSIFDVFLREEMVTVDDSWFETLQATQPISQIRKWSTALAQYGFPISAILIRRKLVESTLMQAKSTYYKYAVSDLKKSIDFTEMVKEQDQNLVASTADFIHAINVQHGRKYSFWEACQGVIPSHYLP